MPHGKSDRRPEHGKPLIRVGPVRDLPESGLFQQHRHGFDGVFVRTLRVDALAFAKVPDMAWPGHREVASRFQVHLDARLAGIEERHMPPLPHIEIRRQQVVDIA